MNEKSKANIGSGNGFLPSGNKPLPEPMLTQVYDDVWHHRISVKHLLTRASSEEATYARGLVLLK